MPGAAKLRYKAGYRRVRGIKAPQPCGDVAEWLRSGLQSRLSRFDSGRRLQRLRAYVWNGRTGDSRYTILNIALSSVTS